MHMQYYYHTGLKLVYSLQASESDTKISIDPSLHHHQRLEEANRGLDNVLSHGADILGNLKAQRFTLKVKLHALS